MDDIFDSNIHPMDEMTLMMFFTMFLLFGVGFFGGILLFFATIINQFTQETDWLFIGYCWLGWICSFPLSLLLLWVHTLWAKSEMTEEEIREWEAK